VRSKTLLGLTSETDIGIHLYHIILTMKIIYEDHS